MIEELFTLSRELLVVDTGERSVMRGIACREFA
jgi:hypothetical protein